MKNAKPVYLVFMLIAILSLNNWSRFQHDGPTWKVGDKVEVKDRSGTWAAATVIKIEDNRSYGQGFYYRIQLDDPLATDQEWTANPGAMRAPLGALQGAP